MRASLRLLLLLLATCLAVGCGVSRTLDGPEIEALLSDAAVQGYHHKSTYHFSRTYRPDGTMVQVRDGTSDEEEATWSIEGRMVCVTWARDDSDTSGGEPLCRTVKTDEGGDYWKILVKRNGDKVRIVTYSSIVDAVTGADRMHSLEGSDYFRVWLASPSGIFTLLAAFALLVMAFFRVMRHPLEPHSLRNRLHRQRPLRLRESTMAYGGLGKLSPGALESWIRDAAQEDRWVYVAWGYEALIEVCPDGTQAWGRLWDAVKDLDDATLITGFDVVLKVAPQVKILEQIVRGDDRAVWILGKTLASRAAALHRTNAAAFEETKAAALVFLQPLQEKNGERDQAITPEQVSDPDPTDYLGLVGPAVEALLYLKYVRRKSSSRGSSGSSGGG